MAAAARHRADGRDEPSDEKKLLAMAVKLTATAIAAGVLAFVVLDGCRAMRNAPMTTRSPLAESDTVTYVGPATVLLRLNGLTALTDPLFGERVGIFRRHVRPGVPLRDLPRLDLILISHGHWDHLDTWTLKQLDKRVVVVVPDGLQDDVRDLGFQDVRELRRLQSFLRMEGRASEVVLRLTNVALADPHRLRLQRMGLEARVDTWRDRLEFVEGMRRNYAFIQSFLVLLTFVAAGIATGVLVYTNIQHKRRSIGILKAIGAKDRGILGLFLAQGLVIGVVGAVVGDLLGGGICYYMSRHPVAVGLSMSSVPLRAAFSADLFILPTFLILVTTAASAFYPAWRAARMEIVEAIWAT